MTDIETIKERLDIVKVVQEYVPNLQRAGQSFKAPCPFHREKSPSFIVTPSLQIYKCFGCGEGGDVIKFIQKIERLDFPQALEVAAQKAGYQLEHKHTVSDATKQKTAKLLELNELACTYWEFILNKHNAGKPGRDYAAKRSLPQEQLEQFRIGYAPKGDNLVKFLQKKGFSVEEIVSAGLGVQHPTQLPDQFRCRPIFPPLHPPGEVLCFRSRLVTPNEFAPKYLNSPETMVYKKGEILMGLFQAIPHIRKAGFVIIEEGNIDLLSSHKVGIGNIVATGGTALTLQQCSLLKRYTDTVYFCFDSDSAGLNALIKGFPLMEQVGLRHKVINISPHQDPDAAINIQPGLWESKVADPQNTIEVILSRLAEGLDLGTADGKSDYFQKAVVVLKQVQDKVQQNHYAQQLAAEVGVAVEDVTNSIKRKDVVPKASSTPETNPALPSHNLVNQKELYLLALLLQTPNLDTTDISQEVFMDPNCREVFINLGRTHDFNQIAESISDGAREVLQQALATDITKVEDPASAAARVYRILYTNFTRSQILSLRQALTSHPEDEELLTKLTYYSRELKQLQG